MDERTDRRVGRNSSLDGVWAWVIPGNSYYLMLEKSIILYNLHILLPDICLSKNFILLFTDVSDTKTDLICIKVTPYLTCDTRLLYHNEVVSRPRVHIYRTAGASINQLKM